MRWFPLFLLFSLAAGAADLRLIGTNLYDFTYAGPANHIRGKVTSINQTTNARVAEITFAAAVEYRMVKDLPQSPSIMTTQDQLELATAFQLSHYDNGQEKPISVGQYMSFSIPLRQYFQPTNRMVTLYLLNPPDSAEVDNQIDCAVIATSKPGIYDFGKYVVGDLDQFRFMYRVLPTRIQRIALTNSPAK